MQKLSVLVNYVIDQYIHILQAKTRKICEILSKKIGIGEGEIYKETQGWEKREQKWTFQPRNLTLSFSHQCLFLSPTMSLSLSLSHSCLCFYLSSTLSLSISLHPFLSFSHHLSLSLSPPLSFSHRLLSLSLFPPPLFLFLSVPPLSLSVAITLSLFQFYSLIVLCKKNQEFVSGLKYLIKIK